ncbi:MAG: phage tail protein, partial [Bacteroidota bacterium]
NVNQLPAHSHGATGTIKVYADTGNQDEAASHNFANAESDLYTNQATNALMTANNVDVTVGLTGGNQPVENIPPFQCVNWIIALQGIYPSRS